MWRPGRPAGIGILVVTRATDPSKPFSIRSLTSITRHSLRLWQSRERNCRAMCNGNLKNFSKARVAALTEDAAKQKALLDVAEERALEFAGERDAARAEAENLKKALSEAKIAQATAEAALAAYKHALGD